MGTNKLTPNTAKWLLDPSITKQDAHDSFGPDCNVHDLTQAEMDASTSVMTKNGASTQDGALIYDVTALANGHTREVSVYDTTLSRKSSLVPRQVTRASLPATGQIGERFYLTDLQFEVEFRNAADDLLLSGGAGIAGWHPTGGCVGLFSNATGALIEANRAVALTAATGTRNIAKTTLLAQENVLGIALHDIAIGGNGYVALPGFARPVLVRVDPTLVIGVTTIEVTAGDYLCSSSSVAGDSRTRGAAQTSGIPAAGQAISGVPAGAFARSLEDRLSGAGIGNVMALMLPAVGSGADAWHDAVLIYANSPAPASANVFACRSSTGGAGTQFATDNTYISAKHLPILAVRLSVEFSATMAAGGSERGVTLGPSTAIVADAVTYVGQGAGNVLGGRGGAVVPTRSTGSSTVIGNQFGFTLISVNITAGDLNFKQTGYRY